MKLLDIRYQHVRKVLLDAGITNGLTRSVEFERAPVAVSVATEPPEPTSGETLLVAGFRQLGEWRLAGDGEFELTVAAPAEPGVYAFIVDGWVRYIGLTQTGLRTRMGHYRRGHKRQRTSARIKAESTVKVHRTNLMRKMQARSLPELSRMADTLKLAPEKPPST